MDPAHWHTRHFERDSFGQIWVQWQIKSRQDVINVICTPWPIALLIPLSPWPFAQWGLDLIGKLSMAPGQLKYVIVAVDYYTKWVEAEPLRKITTECVKNFLTENIYCRFGVPETIVKDNGIQFNNNHLIKFIEKMGTKMVLVSVAHPQTNKNVEAVNKIIKKLLKKKLDEAKGLWDISSWKHYGQSEPQLQNQREKHIFA